MDLAFGPCSIWTQVPKDPFLFDNFFRRPGGRKVDRHGDSIRRLHEPLEGLGPPFVQQRLLPKLLRPIGPPQGAHNRTNIFTFFFVAWVFEKSTLLGTQSVASLTLSGVQAKSLFNKDCLQSFPGPPGRPKEPTRGPTFSQKFSKKIVASKSRPSRGLDLSAPCSSGGIRSKLC